MSEVVICNVDDPCTDLDVRKVIIEVAHRTLRFGDWRERFLEYDAAGVEEYYLIHPGPPMDVEVWYRQDDTLAPVRDRNGFVSPRLGLRLVLIQGELMI